MADIPMINNIKGKLIPSAHRDNEDDVFEGDDELSNAQNDVLEQFRIPAHTELEDDMLTPSKLSRVQFNESTPRGFSFKQVEAYHTSVTKSIKRYIDLLERRDRDVHKLATEVDKYRTDVQNVRFQLELLQGSGQALVNDDGEYLKESDFTPDQLRIVELENLLATAQDDLKFARKRNNELEHELNNQPAVAPTPAPVVALPGATPTNADLAELTELRQRQVELDQWEQDVVAEYNRMEGEYEASVKKVDELTAKLDKANATITSLNARGVDESALNTLREELAEAVSQRDEFERAYHEYEASYKALETTYRELDGAYKELETASTELDTAYSTLESAYKELEDKETTSGDEVAGYVRTIQELNEHIGSLNDQIDSLNKQIETLEAQQPDTGTTYVPGYKLPAGVRPEDLGL
ncbi:MAG: hypothetical protein H9W81_21940 [Enterococcus sp.]|nr:hypothetical protein [Enterococcus sp.]